LELITFQGDLSTSNPIDDLQGQALLSAFRIGESGVGLITYFRI
jgi:hypothetical protein